MTTPTANAQRQGLMPPAYVRRLLPETFVNQPQGRLTLTSGVPVTTTDVAGVSAIYYTPAIGQHVWLYLDRIWTPYIFSELTLAMSASYQLANFCYDLFIVKDGDTIRLGHGPAWTSTTSRGTGAGTTELLFLGGMPTNKNTMTVRWGSSAGNTISVPAGSALYVGSFFCLTNGQMYDTRAYRFLYNAFNQAPRTLSIADPATNWAYSTAAWRQVNANTQNRLLIMCGLGGTFANMEGASFVYTNTTTPVYVQTGIAINSTNSNAADSDYTTFRSANVQQQPKCRLDTWLPLGFTSYNWVEWGGGSDIQTWTGTVGGVAQFWTGLRGVFTA